MASTASKSSRRQAESVDDSAEMINYLRRKVIALERELEQAYRCSCYDELTGLPNRSLLQDRLDQAIAQAERRRKQVALLFLDLDGFKTVNDRLGHVAGDNLLQQVASRILCSIRKVDTASRFGGDEFLILLPEVDGERGAAEVTLKLWDRLTRPYTIGSATVEITASIGSAVYPSDGCTQNELLHRADTAMYFAKRRNDAPPPECLTFPPV